MAADLPSGTVTFVFTDIVGSTQLIHSVGEEAYGEVLSTHNRLLREAWAAHGGTCFGTEGDAFHVAFSRPSDGIAATVAAQRALAATTWPAGADVRVRMGLHHGAAHVRDGDYWGVEVHYAARLCSAAHGGQVLLSDAGRAGLPADAVDDLGRHGLRDFPWPRRLYHLVYDGLRASDFPAPRTLEPRRTIPVPGGPLVGREREVAELRAMLDEDGCRVVTIVGPGGSGKTRLSIAVAEAASERTVAFVALAPVGTADEVLPALARALELEESGDVEAALARAVAGEPALFVLDNLEHLTDAAAGIARLIEAAPDLRILATSQAPMRIRAERLYPLGPLEYEDAVSLFVERAQARSPGFSLTDVNRASVGELCHRLGGAPLAVELAASRVALLPPPELVARLEEDFDALGRGGADLPARQRGLGAAVDWTLSLLDEADRSLFARLGVFVAPWSLEQAEAVCGDGIDVMDSMAQLLDYSVLRPLGDGRFDFPQALRHYSRRRLADEGAERWRRRHAVAFGEEAEAIHRQFFLNVSATAGRAERAFEDVLAALRWSREADRELHARITGAAVTAAFAIGRHRELAGEVAAARRAGPPDALSDAMLAHGEALLAAFRGDWGEAFSRADAGVAAAEVAQDTLILFLAEMCAAWMRHLSGDGEASARRVERLLSDQRFADPAMTDFARGTLAHALFSARRPAEAMPLLEELMASGATHYAAESAHTLAAETALVLGDAPAALQGAIDALRDQRSSTQCVWLLETAAGALSLLGRDEEAVEIAVAVEEQRRSWGMAESSAEWRALIARLVSRARESLPAGALEAAISRGRSRTFEDTIRWAVERQSVSDSGASRPASPHATARAHG